jgi:pimeloyl-ACP methyl ester carboxylesterase
MNKTIIFISGWQVPKFIAKTKWVWDAEFWSDYKCIWISSKTPTSDGMVRRELDRLQSLLRRFPEAAVAGQSLGGWWASNLALRPDVKIRKMVLWTPLGNAEEYPIFNVTPRYHPLNQPLTNTYGPHRVLVYSAKDDLIVPPASHGNRLVQHFSAIGYPLKGGHLYQSNHQEALEYMKDWIEV